ncbi:ATP dependent DNA ligase [Naegleria gruberi]|uniref:DNA ligase n=1 Tax=Naegleria gruberi TaxID=5762 RepID=D2W3T0_NAEGR|nr:ATP dependent DNA ligase [Naegleria gruberi]EFC36317.1 ATP dependent DNA ligase [Naegleria gruberi]|eukprot:XP_002669061.1 ATP dependent DNA ligase [Naegleria gruberi strain NEG-M]
MKLFHPVKPMLARPSKTYDDVIARCPNGFYSELKYDGERIQIHYDRKNDEIKYFSRNLKDVQEYKIKSVKKYISKAIKEKVESVILDGEILMMDTKTNKILPFGTLGKNVRQDHKDAVTTIFLFDILYYNGKSLLSVPLYKRKALMTKIVNPIKHRVMLGEYLVVKGSKQTREAIVSAEMSAMIKKGEEGLVLKDLCSPYEPNARHWLKMKKDYLKGMADSVDLVVLGAYLGTGSKGGLMSVFMMGSFDKKLGKWRIICKCGNGHDDQTIETLNEELKSNMKRISKDPSLVPDDIDIHTNALVPDFIVKDPKKSVVWEIQGAEFSVSSRKDRPISVRFPRVTKIRDDKDVLDHTNYQEIIKLKNESNRKGLVPIFGDGDAGDDSDESVDVKDKKKRSRAKKSKSDDEDDESDSSSKKKKNSRKKKINSSDDEDDEDDKKSAKKPNDKKKSKSSDNSDDDDDPKAKKAKKSTIGIKLSDIDTINNSSTPEQIYYIYGDFMKMPMNKEEKLISHCVDDSSRWSDKGSMGNIELLYGEDIKKAYTDDMNIIGDAQIVVALPNHLCNMVCLQFVKKGSAPKVDYHALDECLKKCATYMNQKKIGTFHLYRLHHAISGLDWNRVEQLLKENLSNKGFAVFIYTKDRDDKDRVNESKNKLANRPTTDNSAAASDSSHKMDTSDDNAPTTSTNKMTKSSSQTSIKVEEQDSSSNNTFFRNVVALISGYSNSEKEAISKFITNNGGSVTNNWNIIGNANTHLICESETEDFKHCFNLGSLIVTKYWVFECATKGYLVDTLPYHYPTKKAQLVKPTIVKAESSSLTAPPELTSLCDLFTDMVMYIHKDVPALKMHTRYIIAFDGIVESSFSDDITHIITSSSRITPEIAKLVSENPQVNVVSSEWIWHSINTSTLIDWRLYQIK